MRAPHGCPQPTLGGGSQPACSAPALVQAPAERLTPGRRALDADHDRHLAANGQAGGAGTSSSRGGALRAGADALWRTYRSAATMNSASPTGPNGGSWIAISGSASSINTSGTGPSRYAPRSATAAPIIPTAKPRLPTTDRATMTPFSPYDSTRSAPTACCA